MRICLLLVVALLAGCASAQLTKPGATSADLIQDQQRCAYEAEAATAAVNNPVSAGIRDAMLQKSCMAARGWRR